MDSIQLFKAMADETRLRLLHVLNRYELNVNELVSLLSMGQSRISRHLKILHEAGLLTARRDGLWMFYSCPASQQAVNQYAGKARELINAVIPFLADEPQFRADLALAAGIIEERANKTRQFFNSVAEDWDSMATEVLGEFSLPTAVTEHMPPCDTAVDLGCGTGNIIAHLLTKAKNVIGVDGSARMLELARRRFSEQGERVSLRIGDLEHLPLRDGEADFICLNMVLHHLSHPVPALMEIKRVMRSGGKLFLSDFDKHENENMRVEYGDRWLGFNKETVAAFLHDAGFATCSWSARDLRKGLRIHLILAEKPALTGA